MPKKKTKKATIYAIPLLGIYPEKNMIPKDTRTLMFVTALFTTDKTLKQPQCPSAEEWIEKTGYTYTMAITQPF